MIELTKLRCYRNFKPLSVVNVIKRGKPSNQYKIVLESHEKVGAFSFSDMGFIENLEIKRKFRRTKTGTNALISLYNFAILKAKEMGLDCLFFRGHNNNHYNVVKLYKRIGVHTIPDGDITNFSLPILPNKQEVACAIKKMEDMAKNIISK